MPSESKNPGTAVSGRSRVLKLFWLYKIDDSAVSDVRVTVTKKVSELASANVAARARSVLVEARGIEPLSENPFMQLSTSVFYLL